jgi:hypothetical protein
MNQFEPIKFEVGGMKGGTKKRSTEDAKKRSAEDWVSIARKFGEDCVEIQRNSELSVDQKLEKQRALANKMAKEVEKDTHLAEKDKHQMVTSIHNYMDEWETLYKAFKKV